MTVAAKNIMVRVIKKRMKNGETFDEIIANYPKLTEEDVTELKETLGIEV